MKINKVLQRICATTIAVATVATSFVFSPPIVQAATYGVNFVDNITDKKDRSAVLLEGETIKTISDMPTNYKFLNPPFVVKGIAPGNSPITVTPEGKITAKAMAAGDTDTMKLYTVEPVFSAFLTESDTGVATCNIGKPDARTAALKAVVLDGKDVSITELSTLTLTVLKDQTDPKGGHLEFKPVTATGGLLEFNGGIVAFKRRNGDVISLEVSKDGRNISMDLTANFPELIAANSTFALTFALQNLGDLQLTVISKKKAVDTIATDIAAAANLSAFLKLKAGDTQHTISSQFSILHTEKRYNHVNGFKIDWKWKPTVPADDIVVRINGAPADSDWQAKIFPKEDNVTGSLVATVTYGSGTDLVTSTVISAIPITILGTGTPPKLEAVYSYTGDTATGGKPQKITAVPGKMDVNEGAFVGYEGKEPYKFTGELYYGTGLGKAENIKIEFDTAYAGRVDISFDNSTSIYKPGTMLPPPNSGSYEATRPISVKASAAGLCVMKVFFYNKSGDLYNKSPKTYNINIEDSSPISDPSFKSMKMTGTSVNAPPEYKDRFDEVYPDGIIDFGFNVDPTKRIYADITVPWAVESVDLTPIYNALGKVKTYPVEVINGTASQNVTGTGKTNGGVNATTSQIKLPDDGTTQIIYVNGTAEDGLTFSRYELHIKRAPKSDIASLVALTVTSRKNGKDEEHVITPVFDPITYDYTLSLPYAYRTGNPNGITTTMQAVAFGDWGADPIFGGAVETPGFLARIFRRKGTANLVLPYVRGDENVHVVTARVVSEDGKKTANYNVHIKIEDPSENNELSDLKATDRVGQPIPFYNGQKFEKASRDYYLEIPYSMEELKFELLPDDEKAQAVRTLHPEVYKVDPNPQEVEYTKKGAPVIVKVNVPPPAEDVIDKVPFMKFDYQFHVKAESDEWTAEPYTLHITRLDPSEDSRLASMGVVNAADNVAVDTYRFVQQKTEYTFEVPFTTEEIVVSPVAVKPDLTTVTIGDTKISANMPGKIIKLGAGKVTVITVVVKPEAGEAFQTIYTLNVTRKAPGTEARLQKLIVDGGEDMTPSPFVPSNTRYTVSIPKGTESYTVTGIPVDPKATITVNGKEVENGKPSLPIVSVAPISEVRIVVTAEDGKTKMTYIVTIKDYNLMVKSDNADLSDLKIAYADLAPKFKTGIEEYELYVKPETKSLDITPITAHASATMEVLVGSKKLTPYNGVYSSSLFVDKTTFTINVTSEDTLKTKKYIVNVFRDDKKKNGAFKPITSEMVDYVKQDPIVIDITNYAVIDASVFNTLKTDFPDKSIVFKGNDYMLKIAGKDITDLVPHTTQYDLYFSFTTPEEQLIQEILGTSEKDWNLEPVYLYFDDHGPLPGKMILTVNLGREYQNKQLFWNYYNGERERIDYYGYVNSNAKGTFTVPITHLSTYMVAPKKIIIAADKTGSGFGTVDDSGTGSGTGTGSGNANGGASGDKEIPTTGVSPIHNPRKQRSEGGK